MAGTALLGRLTWLAAGGRVKHETVRGTPEHTARNARAGRVWRKGPGAAHAGLNHPQPVIHIDASGHSHSSPPQPAHRVAGSHVRSLNPNL